jgi:SAM-dependent methyltransferase
LPAVDRRNLAYWTGLSGKWSVAPPLAPCDEDLRWFQRQLGRLDAAPCRALLFGVTPGLAKLAWPAGTSLAALDWSAGMLRSVFPREGTATHSAAVLADWRELPIADRSCDVIVGDGCYTALGDRESARLMSAEMARVLKPGGLACFRCFARPSGAASVDDLFRELGGGTRPAFDLFRWRLAVAVQGDRWGVSLGEVWQTWDLRVPDRESLASRLGWVLADLQRIERWKNEPARYAFASLAELRQLVAPQFELLEADTPRYERGEYFPRVALRARR